MASLKGFWQFLNTDVKDIPWGELAEKGIEAVGTAGELGEKWEEHKSDLNQLEPYFEKVEPFFKVLNSPDTQMVLSGLPFVSIGVGLLRIYLNLSKTEPTFESSVFLVAQLAHLQSLDAVLTQVTDAEVVAKLEKVSLHKLLEKQITKLDTDRPNSRELEIVTSQFRESKLAEQFGEALTEQLQQAELEATAIQKIVEQVSWGTPRYLYQAIAEAGDGVEPLARFYRSKAQQEQDRYVSIEAYLKKKIAPLPTEQVFDESDPLITFKDIYVPLNVQPLTQSGENKKGTSLINIHDWAKKLLKQSNEDETRKVMFVEGEAGRGKSVFCRMLADQVRVEMTFSFIPILIRARDIRCLANNLTETLENYPDLEQTTFVRGKSDWLADPNTRFLIIFDGFDELLLEGRTAGGLKEFLQQVADFQVRSHHQCLVTGRPLALQGIDRLITQTKNLERVKLETMDSQLQEQWLRKWAKAINHKREIIEFRKFLKACPIEITNNLAGEPLLMYLLAHLHRKGNLKSDMFADTEQESQARLQVYRESVNWVLEKQRQDENLRLSGLDDPDDLREVLREVALCVVQSGSETAQLTMLKTRFQDTSNPVATLLKTTQDHTKQSEDKALNNLLTTFYLRPGEGDKRGSVEFAHKSFGEYLFAERLISTFETWTELDRKNRFRLDDHTVHSQIYDLLGFGGLTVEIVEYLFHLMRESAVDPGNLFNRFHSFYENWHEGIFIDRAPTENLPQKKFLQLKEQGIPIGLKHVEVFAGINILILLFRLHSASQVENCLVLSENTSKHRIIFYPCGEPDTEQFDADRLLRSVHYADSLSVDTFNKVVGPHLSRANFSNANLKGVNFERVNLSRANLEAANLEGINLSRANLNCANLSKANLYRAHLYKINLHKSNLTNSNLSHAKLNYANLSKSNLSKANLDSVNLYRASLSFANLDNTYLESSTLQGSNLNCASLRFANLTDSDLSAVIICNANLSNANLSNTNFYSANLSKANLYSVNLSNANCFNANFNSANLARSNLSKVNFSNANFDRADIKSSDLSGANLYRANLHRANLNNAVLCRANLDSATLNKAVLYNTNLDYSNLEKVNFSSAVLLNTNLCETNQLTVEHLLGYEPPLICRALLPKDLEAYQDRDCRQLAELLREGQLNEVELPQIVKRKLIVNANKQDIALDVKTDKSKTSHE